MADDLGKIKKVINEAGNILKTVNPLIEAGTAAYNSC